jgi:hypothetical protein
LPLAVMDGTFMNYLKSTPDEAFEIIRKIINETARVGGTFISLWHNDSLQKGDVNKEWVALYEKVYWLAASKHDNDYDPLHTA